MYDKVFIIGDYEEDFMKKHDCIICGKPMYGGIMINGAGICKNCEDRILRTEAETDFYTYYIECIKKTIAQSLMKGEDIKCQNYHL